MTTYKIECKSCGKSYRTDSKRGERITEILKKNPNYLKEYQCKSCKGSTKSTKKTAKKPIAICGRFIDNQGMLSLCKMGIDLKFNILFRGKTGTGKTFLLNELAEQEGKTLEVLNMTTGVGIEEIKGRYVIKPTKEGKSIVKWVDGVLIRAMKNGYWLVVEEFNFMRPELASVFYSLLDDRKNIVLDEHENEVVEAHPDFRIFFTGNWGYRGTSRPNDAVMNRIDMYFDFDYLPRRLEANLLVDKTGVDKEIATLMSDFAWKIRESKSRNIPDISTRILIRWATLVVDGMDVIKAGEHTIISLMHHEKEDKDNALETLRFTFSK